DDSAGTPMIPCIVGGSTKGLQLSDALMRRGINADPIVYPAAPEGKPRLRFFVSSCHSSEHILFMVEVLAEELELLNACSQVRPRKPAGEPPAATFARESRKGLAS